MSHHRTNPPFGGVAQLSHNRMFEQVANQALGGGNTVGEGHKVSPMSHEIARHQFEQNW